MAESIAQGLHHVARESTLGETNEDLFHDSHLELQERMRNPIAFHAKMMGDSNLPQATKVSECYENKVCTLVLTYGTYLPVPCHITVTTFQLIPVGSRISLDITLGIPPHHLQWN
jgi:hypothetical protein